MQQLVWAIISCVLTLKLTASTSFKTRKDSGVLSPAFASDGEANKIAPSQPDPKRKVMYYVRISSYRTIWNVLTSTTQAAGSGIPEIKTILSGKLEEDTIPPSC